MAVALKQGLDNPFAPQRALEKGEFKISQPSFHAYHCKPQQMQSAAEQQTENSCLPTLSFLKTSELFILHKTVRLKSPVSSDVGETGTTLF